MNQNRWTCLATVVFTAVTGPIANVHASALPISAPRSEAGYIPVSPQSLPTVTPLVVTEAETEAIMPAQAMPVPLVSKLPIVKVVANRSKLSARSSKIKVFKPVPQPTAAKQQSINPIFSADIRITDSAFPNINPSDPAAAVVSPVFPLPLPASSLTPTDKIFIGPIPNVAAIGTKVDRVQPNSLPQPAPIIRDLKDYRTKGLIQGQDLPMFEAGVPTFGLNDRTTQVVVTAIAQVGDTIVAPEPSIAIPIEQPKQQPIPTKSPTALPSTVKIEQPAATTSLDKIVSTQSGQASWYGSEAGSKTASGERYNPSGLTAAHRTLPFGTKVKVTSLKTGKTVVVRINDRGPFIRRRIIDVSAGAAEAIGIKSDGVGQVRMDVLAGEG